RNWGPSCPRSTQHCHEKFSPRVVFCERGARASLSLASRQTRGRLRAGGRGGFCGARSGRTLVEDARPADRGGEQARRRLEHRRGERGEGRARRLHGPHRERLAGVEMVHVPYKGGGPAVQSVLAGDTQLSFATPPSVLPLVNAGRLRVLAVTSRERTPLVPGVPGMAQAGLPDYEISFWYGF